MATKAIKNAVIFVRGTNIKEQLDACKAHTEKQGYTIAGVIMGKGNDLKTVLESLEIKIDIVVVKDVMRISRNTLEYCTIQNELQTNYGAVIESAAI